MDTDSDLIENIKACRTCGIHYVTPSKHQLKHLFQSSLEHSELLLIRLELAQWNIEVAENDGFPQYVCNTCIHKFEKVFELRTACITAQKEFRKFYALPNGNMSNVKIKTELPDRDEEKPECDFIYVDDLSDSEYDGVTPFNFPHIPIKEEVTEAATIPMEESDQSINMLESASRVVAPAVPSIAHIPESVPTDQSSESVHKAVDVTECKICQHISSNQDEHKQHMYIVHETRDFECHICGKEFKNSTASRLKFHMKWHTLNKHVKCNLCGFVCNSKDALKEHKRVNHRKLICKICGKGILAKKMKSHLRHHELISKYSCEYCTEAFDTENDRESHIWQIHAHEDNIASFSSVPTYQTTCMETSNENPFKVPQDKNSLHDAQENILYKFMCAHCDHRFIEQIDLEIHVNEEHRANKHLPTIGQKTAAFVEESHIRATELAQTEQDINEQLNMEIYEEYTNNDAQQYPCNESSLDNTPILSQDFSFSSSDFVNQSENMQSNEIDLSLNSSPEEESECRDMVNYTNGDLLTYDASDINTFACANCSETFASIEQLRQHHEQHLANDQQQQKLKPALDKSKFKCNFCQKSFDLKFSLNRHVKKHKHVPV